MKSIKTKIALSSFLSIFVTFAIVLAILFFTLDYLKREFIGIVSSTTNYRVEKSQAKTLADISDIKKSLYLSLQKKASDLIERDELVIKPAFIENSYSTIGSYLQKTHALDKDIILASFFEVSRNGIKLWHYFTQKFPSGVPIGYTYDERANSWRMAGEANAASIFDEKISEIIKSHKSTVELRKIKGAGGGDDLEIYEAYIPIFEGSGEEDFLNARSVGEPLGYLRYQISLERIQNEIQSENMKLMEYLNKERLEENAQKDVILKVVGEASSRSIIGLVISGIVIIIVSGMVSKKIGSILAGSIQALNDSANFIAGGNYHQKVPQFKSNDEIMTLSESFEKMRTAVLEKISEIKEHNLHLEEKVQERTRKLSEKTREVRSILENINQGIFSINKNDLINHEYSQHLETVLETSDIADKPFSEVFLSRVQMPVDQKQRLSQTLYMCLDEGFSTFLVNAHLLPREMIIETNNKKKVVQADWTSILDDDEMIEKILVSVRDVTELKKLEKQARRDQEELNIIKEITQLGMVQYNSFVSRGKRILKDNRAKLERSPE
ncbi:MAG: hypothetical protein HQK54_03070, partial [Oligoflexales bacterium]|nr:hypothetical protein [Oligoflexales bacterium]